MGFNLYDEMLDENGKKTLTRKKIIDFTELNREGPLFFGARRSIMRQADDLRTQNSAAHNTVGRHGAGFFLRPGKFPRSEATRATSWSGCAIS
jgi:hypothetical protein